MNKENKNNLNDKLDAYNQSLNLDYVKKTKIKDHQELVDASRLYLGTPFQHRGRKRGLGIDCGGLVIESLKDCGCSPTDFKVYGREPARDGLRQYMRRAIGDPIDKKDMQVGDIALIKFVYLPHHVAIVGDYVYGGFSLIHAYGESEKVVEHRLDDKWYDKILEVYRFELE